MTKTPITGSDDVQFEPMRPSATIHRIYDPYNPPLNAIISVARRLQEVLLQTGALDGRPLPFPELAPAWCRTSNDN